MSEVISFPTRKAHPVNDPRISAAVDVMVALGVAPTREAAAALLSKPVPPRQDSSATAPDRPRRSSDQTDNANFAVPKAVTDQFRSIAAASGIALMTEGKVHPDWRLIELCADALHHLTAAELASAARPSCDRQWADKDRKLDVDLFAEQQRQKSAAHRSMFLARKIKATTPAGIYAKALVMRKSKTGAAELAISLAIDLVDCKELRATLWPTAATGERAP